MSTQKTFTKEVILTQAQYKARLEAGTLVEGVKYDISDAKDDVTDVKVNGTSVVNATTGVANIPLASASAVGVVRPNNSYALAISSGVLDAMPKTYNEYKSLQDISFIAKGTLENVLTNESLRIDGTSQTVSSENQAAARETIGAQVQMVYSADWDTLTTL